jgi:hypothetical protein
VAEESVVSARRVTGDIAGFVAIFAVSWAAGILAGALGADQVTGGFPFVAGLVIGSVATLWTLRFTSLWRSA